MAVAINKHEYTDIVKYILVKREMVPVRTIDGLCICGKKEKSSAHGFIRVDGID